MIVNILGIFLILHGIVFYLYVGQSARLYELKPGLTWPDDALLIPKILNRRTVRKMGVIFCVIGGTGFIISGVAALFGVEWWQICTIVICIFTSIVIILLWNGSLQKLSEQGLVGLIINLLILLYLMQ